jgi:hypothetical protein
MIPPALDSNNECSAPSSFMCRRTYQNRDHNPAVAQVGAPAPGAAGGSIARGPTLCQPQKMHMLALKLGLPMFLRTEGGHRVVLFTRPAWVPASARLRFLPPAA